MNPSKSSSTLKAQNGAGRRQLKGVNRMGRKMTRGKQQILFNYLPGRTFDFDKNVTIARVTKIKGVVRTDLNAQLILNKISEEAQAWQPEFRPALRDEILRDPNRFVLLEPATVSAEIFPRVFWCQNQHCGRVIDAEKLRDAAFQVPRMSKRLPSPVEIRSHPQMWRPRSRNSTFLPILQNIKIRFP